MYGNMPDNIEQETSSPIISVQEYSWNGLSRLPLRIKLEVLTSQRLIFYFGYFYPHAWGHKTKMLPLFTYNSESSKQPASKYQPQQRGLFFELL